MAVEVVLRSRPVEWEVVIPSALLVEEEADHDREVVDSLVQALDFEIEMKHEKEL